MRESTARGLHRRAYECSILKANVVPTVFLPNCNKLQVVGEAATFVSGSTASELSAKLDGLTATGLVWIPGVAGTEAKSLLELQPTIEWLHSFSAGVDTLVPHLDSGRQVATTNGRGAFSSSLAEYVFAGALHFNKQLSRSERNLRLKKWDQFTMPVLRGKTMGFVGYGHIAKETAKLARAFGMRVIACRRSLERDPDVDAIYSPEDRLTLFLEADFVVCSLPGTAETRDFCGVAEFGAMKESAVFISIGRGAAVDEDALYAALRDNRIAGAALDVFKTEPLPRDSPLWELGSDKLVLTPHNADLTEDYFVLGWSVWRENFEALQRAKASAQTTIHWITPFDSARGY